MAFPALVIFSFTQTQESQKLNRQKNGADIFLHSNEGLTLETSAFLTFHCGNSTFINSFDKTKIFILLHSLTLFVHICSLTPNFDYPS